MQRRTINVNGDTWTYHVGKSYLRLTSPDGRSRAIPFTAVTDMTWPNIERAQWKGYFRVTPSMIRDTILRLSDATSRSSSAMLVVSFQGFLS